MLESLPTDPLVTGILTVGALVAALAVIWTKAVRPFVKWIGDAVRNIRRVGDLLERMIDFLERERDAMLARLDVVERQNIEGKQFHDEIDKRVKVIEGGGE